jgi:hypothetical protein
MDVIFFKRIRRIQMSSLIYQTKEVHIRKIYHPYLARKIIVLVKERPHNKSFLYVVINQSTDILKKVKLTKYFSYCFCMY